MAINITYKERFFVTSNGNTYYAPFTWAPPAFTNYPDRSCFTKTKEEKLMIKIRKEEQNKKFKQIFGTKRPTAGRVKRYYANPDQYAVHSSLQRA